MDVTNYNDGLRGGRVKVRAKITNQETDESKTIDLVPHINLIDIK